jgi:hypothetical protein
MSSSFFLNTSAFALASSTESCASSTITSSPRFTRSRYPPACFSISHTTSRDVTPRKRQRIMTARVQNIYEGDDLMMVSGRTDTRSYNTP